MEAEKIHIYVLQLEDGKFYVGKSRRLVERIEQHFEGNGSRWTTLHPVVKLLESFEGSTFDEDKYVKIYMSKYGIDNVRGGSYCREILSPEDRKALKKELNGANDNCFRCGRHNHFARDCYATYHLDGSKIEVTRCHRCGRENHFARECYAKRHVNGDLIVERQPEVQTQCYSCKGNHHVSDCPTKSQICYNCGSPDHWKITCTATHDINGKPLDVNPIGIIGAAIKSWWY